MNSYRNPAARWLGSPNFTPDRAGHDMTQPSWVVLHTMVGTAAAAGARFQNPDQQASATYGVLLDGSLVQWVDEKDAAWANGATGRGGAGDNLDSISIEHEDNGDYNGPRTPALYRASALLVRDVCVRNKVPIDRAHVIRHRECDFAQTACPDSLDIDRIVGMAAGTLPLPVLGGFMDALTPEQQQQMYSWLSGLNDQVGTGYVPNGVAASLLEGNSHAQEDLLKAINGIAGSIDVATLATQIATALAPHLQNADLAQIHQDLAQLPDQVRLAFAAALNRT